MRYGTLNPKGMATNKALLAVPMGPHEPFSTLVATQRAAHEVQAANNQPVPQTDQFNFLKAAIEGGPRNVTIPMSIYCSTNTTVEAQTFDSLATHFENFFGNATSEDTTATGGYAATVAVPTAPDEPVTLAGLAQLVAVLMANQAVSNDRGGIQQGNHSGTARTDHGGGAEPTAYCWTHGTTTNLAHTSASCTRPGPGHVHATTARNRMGGTNNVCRSRWSRQQHK